MNKAVPSLVALGVVAGIATGVVLWNKEKSAPDRGAANLVPPETVLLLELPDLHTSATRWKETALAKLWAEPEVQAFLERPRAALSATVSAATAPLAEHATRLREAGVQGGFVAVTSVEENQPRLVAGARFAGSRAAAEALIASARERAQKANPAGKTTLEPHGRFEVESFSHDGVTVAGAFAGPWYFVANDVPLLKATLDRLSAETAVASLADAEPYKKSLAKLPTAPDLVFYAQPAFFIERLVAMAAISGQPLDPQAEAELRKLKAVAGAMKMEGAQMRDAYYFLQPGVEKPAMLSGSTLELTSTSTLFYLASGWNLPEKLPAHDPNTAAALENIGISIPSLADLERRLTEAGIPMESVRNAFGPEFGMLNTTGAAGEMQWLAALQVRDAEAARKTLETVLGGDWARQDQGATPVWSKPISLAGRLPLQPALGLTEGHLILGLSADAIRAGVEKKEGTLADSPAWKQALQTVPKAETTLAYLDTKAVFEQTYGVWRGQAMMLVLFMPAVTQYVDLAKLPQTETIAKHLQPSILSGTYEGEGALFESTGTVTVYQGIIGLSGAAGAAIVPLTKGGFPLPGGLPGLPQGNRPAAPSATPAPQSEASPE